MGMGRKRRKNVRSGVGVTEDVSVLETLGGGAQLPGCSAGGLAGAGGAGGLGDGGVGVFVCHDF